MKNICSRPWLKVLHWALPLAMALTAGSAWTAPQPASIRIAAPDQSAGSLPFAGNNPIALAHLRGALEQEFAADGIKIEWSFFKGAGPAINEAFANRQIDFAYLGDLASIIGRAGGLQTRFLFAVRGSNLYLGSAPDASISRLQDLKGKRVALFRGTADQLALGRALAEVGLHERDLRIVNLDWTAARAAIAAGQVDAAWQGSGLLAVAERGQIKIALSTQTLHNRRATTQSGLVGTQAFIDQYPALTQRLIKVLVQQAHWAADPAHQAELLQAWAQQGGRPLKLLQREFAGEDLRFRFSPRIDTFITTSYVESVQTAQSLGLIRSGFDARAWLEPRFVDAALRELKWQHHWPSYDANGQAPAPRP
jgi:sulfonate transport system substrate-binding protein